MDIDSFYYLENVRKIILLFPGVEEYACYSTPAFRVNKKLLVRLREDGESLAARNEERDEWIKKNPSVYFVTEHYFNYPTLLVHLAKVNQKELKIILQTAWKSRATKKQLKEFEERK